MKKYRISWIDEVTREQFVEAESEEKAKEMFFDGDCREYKTLDVKYLENTLIVEEEERDLLISLLEETKKNLNMSDSMEFGTTINDILDKLNLK